MGNRTFQGGGELVQGQGDRTLPNVSLEKEGGSVAGVEQTRSSEVGPKVTEELG